MVPPGRPLQPGIGSAACVLRDGVFRTPPQDEDFSQCHPTKYLILMRSAPGEGRGASRSTQNAHAASNRGASPPSCRIDAHRPGTISPKRRVTAPGDPQMRQLLQRRSALAALLLLLLPADALAAAPQPAPLTAQDNLELQRVAAYLNCIRTMTARFSHVTGHGGTSSGRMWVSRPGKMRFEYDKPTPIAMLADAAYV